MENSSLSFDKCCVNGSLHNTLLTKLIPINDVVI